MPKYLITANYTEQGMKGVAKAGGSARRSAVEETIRGLGGTMESFHFAFGPHDAYVIGDLPDNVTASAIAIAVGSSGAASVETTVLLTPEEVDAAAEKAVDYRPPGK